MGCSATDDEAGECADVLHDVWMFLDDEMDVQRRMAVQRHLDDCSPCLEEAGLSRKLKTLLATKCGGDRAPEELRTRLVAKLSAIEVTAELDASGVVTTTTAVSTTAITATSTDRRQS
jgi:mycothiol system anti-sigma-R factor